jgi:hypothetical protein
MSSSAAAAASNFPTDKSGYLLLQDVTGNGFSRYYFVLSKNELFYYSDESSLEESLGRIELEGCSVELLPEQTFNNPYSFELNSPLSGMISILQADNSVAAQEWINLIRRAMLRIRRDKAKAAAINRRLTREENNNTTTTTSNNNIETNSTGNNSSQQVTHTPNIATVLNSSPSLTSSPSLDHSNSSVNPYDSSNPTAKYDIYRQWLEESKAQPKSQPLSANSSNHHSNNHNSMHNRLLSEEDQRNRCELCGVDVSRCVIS